MNRITIAFLFVFAIATAIFLFSFTSKNTQQANYKTSDPSESNGVFHALLSQLTTLVVQVTKDTSSRERNHQMVFLAYEWKLIQQNQKMDTFYLSSEKNHTELGIWFHIENDASVNKRIAIAQELNTLLSPLISDSTAVNPIQAFILDSLERVSSTQATPMKDTIGGYSLSINPVQDQEHKFLIQFAIQFPQ